MFGGTFDPPHIGHLVAARNACHQLHLDAVLFVVAGDPWQKTGRGTVSPAATRLAMVEVSVRDLPRFEVGRHEVDRAGPSYMVDTLTALRRERPGADLVVLVGADAARNMPTWERFEEVVALAQVAMIDRPEPDAPPPAWVGARVTIPLLDISSSSLRRRVATGEPLDHLVPAAVVSLIDELGLYRDPVRGGLQPEPTAPIHR